MSARSSSLVTLSQPTSPKFSVVCFHHAGGSAAGFQEWKSHFPGDIGLHVALLPGRERRFGQRHHQRVEDAAAEFVDAISDAFAPGLPLVLVGHSLGGLVAYESTRQLGLRSRPPLLTVISAVSAVRRRLERRWEWDDGKVAEMMRMLGGTPDEVFEHPDLLQLCVEILRADLRLVDTYDPGDHAPTASALIGVGGRDDLTVPVEEISAWSRFTTGPSRSHIFDGGHFFLHDHPRTFADWLLLQVANQLEHQS